MFTSRLRRTIAGGFAILAVTAFLSTAAAVPPATAAGPRTTVSLTFDDADASQLSALPILQKYGMKATFFIPSGFVGAAGYMTRSDLDSLKAAGHEIGGHTVNHPDLATLPADEAKRQICTDRSTLTSWGFTLRSFAYPFASASPAVEKAASDCGYRSARLLGDLRTRFDCQDCDVAETLPPSDRFGTKALPQFEANWTLDDLKQGVLNAESTGGWVQYTFHDVCDNACTDIAISPALLDQFLSWLKQHMAAANTVVKTVGDAVGGTAKPVVNGPVVPAAAAGVNAIKNPGMETLTAGAPSCWMQGGWGQNTAAFSKGSPAHGGSVASRVSMSNYVSGDAKLLPQFDLGACAPTVVTGHTYSLRSWYTSTAVTQFAVYLRASTGVWQYWTSSPWFSAASAYTQAEWTTPAIPAGYTGISFALNVFSNGTLQTDDVSMYDSTGAPAATSAQTAVPGASSRIAVQPPTGAPEVAQDLEGE
ncbi:polysaccharide deacetylase family protein [Microbacterium hatanonis]|uniref:Polysaccharide deacetylase family protein n=1 Tax=Microbacterium hatanonis TaxID=404366 RepID=A0A5C8I548_9MICO|nr:polysaccharide deacetylase family protein [Microbacterium hatanonis]TXK13184.1 polysaccharide deacetylase family protein [Microbacterium hatanonis]